MHHAGKYITLPAGCHVIHMQRKEDDAAGMSTWSAKGGSRRIRVWEQDIPPCSTTARIRALEWMSLAPQLHTPVAVHDTNRKLAANEVRKRPELQNAM